MAVDLQQLGKLLALTRSSEPEEALRAEEVFTRLFFRWCDEQGLPENVGFARIGDASDTNLLFLETLALQTGSRILQLNTYDLCAVGTLADCRWLSWWFDNVLPQVVETSRKSAYAERDAFQVGAFIGIRAELMGRRTEEIQKHVPLAAVVPQPTKQVTGAPIDAARATTAPPPPVEASAKQQSATRAGVLFGRNLARKVWARCPLPD